MLLTLEEKLDLQIHNITSGIILYTTLKKASLSKLITLHFIKSNDKLIQKALYPKVSYCVKFSRNTIQGVPSNT